MANFYEKLKLVILNFYRMLRGARHVTLIEGVCHIKRKIIVFNNPPKHVHKMFVFMFYIVPEEVYGTIFVILKPHYLDLIAVRNQVIAVE